MRTEKFDLAVVGGGPAGSNCARLAKKYDPSLDVVLFEKGSKPTGNCAGGLGIPFKKHLGIEPPSHVVQSEIHDVIIASPNHEVSISLDDINAEDISWIDGSLDKLGWIVERQEWDHWQLEQASERGVSVRRKHTVSDVSNGSTVEVEVRDREDNERYKIEAKFVALATGTNWQPAIQAGFDRDTVVPSDSELHMGLQYHMKDPEYFKERGKDSIYLLFDRDYAPNGYTWSFSEYRQTKNYTKWGAGVPLSMDKSVKETLNKFLDDNDKIDMKENDLRDTTNALIPTAEPLDTCVNENVALVGDVAHHCDPVHGGGQMFGSRAGKQLARAVCEGDISNYDRYWKDDFLSTLQNRIVLKDLIHNMDNRQYDRFVNSLKGFKVESVNPDREIPRLMYHSFRKDPGIFTRSAAEGVKSMVRQIRS